MMSWEQTTLGEACQMSGGSIQTGPFGSQLHASDYVDVGVPVVMPQNIGDNVIIEDGIARVSEDDVDRLSKYRLKVNDIVYSRRGDVERRALIREHNSGWLCGTGCLKVSFGNSTDISPSFVSYQLGTPKTRQWIVRHAVGATMLNLNTKILKAVPLSLPSIHEQRAIAEVLGALDDKIAANSMKASTAEQLAGVLFDKVSVDLNKVPVSQVLTPILGGTPNRKNPEFWGGQVHWASAKDVTSAPHSVVADTEEKITRMATEQTKAKPLPIGGVIVTARGTVGAVARLALPTSFNQSCYGFSPSELPPGLLYFSILRAAQRAKSLSHGSVFDTITMKTFDHLFIPDFGESAEKMEHQIAPLLETVDSSIKENKTLVSMRDALLPQLMSGKLRVRDAEAVVEDVL